jgi:hypothetical protein
VLQIRINLIPVGPEILEFGTGTGNLFYVPVPVPDTGRVLLLPVFLQKINSAKLSKFV